MLKHGVLLGLSALLALVLAACGDVSRIEDNDNGRAKAPLLPPNLEVKDGINVDEGDLEDWRDFTVVIDSHVTITYVVGSIGEPHTVVGDVTCYDMKSNPLAGEPITPEKPSYELKFDAEGKKHYYCRLRAKAGGAAYTINSETRPIVKDPCAACTPDQKCVSDRCYSIDACVPECSGGELCRDGECVEPACPKGKEWSAEKGACVKKVVGKAQPPAPSPCQPPCGAGTVCDAATKACVARQAPAQPAQAGGLGGAKVLSAVAAPNAAFSVVIIDRGTHHGVKLHMKGKLANGADVEVVEVYPFRCRASVKLGTSAIAPNVGVTFLQ
jgi:hypothetical protein